MLSDPILTGSVSSSYEVHEKINRLTGRGVVALFSTTAASLVYVAQRTPASVVYVTRHAPTKELWASDGTTVTFDREGHAVIRSELQSGAAIVMFGVS